MTVQPVQPERHLRIPERLELTRGAGSLDRVRPQRLEEAVVLIAVGPLLGLDQVLVDQPAHDVEHRHRVDVADRRHDVLGRLHREEPGEHPEPTEEHLLDLVQPVVAPVDRRGQRLLPGEHGAGTAGEEVEPIVELRRDSLHRHLTAHARAASSSASGMPSSR